MPSKFTSEQSAATDKRKIASPRYVCCLHKEIFTKSSVDRAYSNRHEFISDEKVIDMEEEYCRSA